MNRFEVVSETVEWEGQIVKAGRETYRYADGHENTYDKVWHAGAVTVVAYDETHVWLVRQPREASRQQNLLEIPAGKCDRDGEALLDLAKRELVEEIGKEAGDWREVYAFYPAPGYCDELVTLYAATELSDAHGGPAPDEHEQIEIVPWPLSAISGAIAATSDAKTLLGLLWLARELNLG